MIIALVNDVLFQQKIENSMEKEGRGYLTLAEEETLWAALQEETPELLLVDIGIATLDGPALIQKLKQNPATKTLPIVAFGTGLRADLLQDARESGADLVLPKAAFREQLTGIIRRYSKPPSH